jgi:catechol-2,3-dioxygenase
MAVKLGHVHLMVTDAGVDYVAVDHGISHAVYFHDPDGLGVEVYLDRRGRPGGAKTWRGDSLPLQI